MQVLSDKEDISFQSLKRLIQKEIGFNCDQYKQSHFKRRIAVRMRACRVNTYHEYIRTLKTQKEEWTALKDALTVNVTEFFRNPEVYEEIKNRVIPDIVKQKSSSNRIEVWSAGCSNGEETYSLAILFYEYLGENLGGFEVHILGTDIDTEVLKDAKKGFYQSSVMKNMPATLLKKYFTEEVRGRHKGFVVSDKLRKIVRFRKGDLISGIKPSGFDLILCRNVTIYFEQSLQEKLYLDFYNSLNKGGFFVMGKTEMLIGSSRARFKTYNSRERIFKKE
jgi:chemotaxis protein methyltransferase CheR